MVGGLAFSQLVTLYVTPVIYSYLDEMTRRRTRGDAAGVTDARRAYADAGDPIPATATASMADRAF